MEKKEATPIILAQMEKYDRILFDEFKELVACGDINPTCNLVTPRTIFYNQVTGSFLYYNQYHGYMSKCGEWLRNPNQ